MTKLLTALVAIAALALGLLILPLVFGLVGAIVGIGFGLFFPSAADALNALVGTAYTWQTGAILGFVSAFFKAS